MRFFAIHDPSGQIFDLVGSPSTGPVMKPLQTAIGELFNEVKLPARLFDPADAKSYTRLAEISATYLVEMPLRKPARLVKKGSQATESQAKLGMLDITPNPVTRGQVPTFDVSLTKPTNQPVNVTITLFPNIPWGSISLPIPLGSVAIPAGQTTMALSSAIPAAVPHGDHTVVATAGANDTVTAVLHLLT